jgi:hypothetical protein
MYVRTLERVGLGKVYMHNDPPQPQQHALRKKITSSVMAYKDGQGNCQSTHCSIFVPSKLRNQPKIDLLLFFHGLDTCKPKHHFDPDLVVQNFRLDDQVAKAGRPAALVVPIVFWNKEDRRSGIIRAAWSAAYLNAFVEEVLDEIGKSSLMRPSLGRLILAGHSAAYDILTPLAEQFDCGVSETKKGALAKLDKVLAMDTTYRTQDAKTLERWAHNLAAVQFVLVLSKAGDPPNIWKSTMGKVKLPQNLKVLNMKDVHCDLPGKYIEFLL